MVDLKPQLKSSKLLKIGLFISIALNIIFLLSRIEFNPRPVWFYLIFVGTVGIAIGWWLFGRKEKAKNIWDIIHQIENEEYDPKKGENTVRLNIEDHQAYPLANFMLINFKKNVLTYIYDMNTSSIVGKVRGNIELVKNIMEKSELTKSYVARTEVEKEAKKRLEDLGFAVGGET